MSDRAVLGQNFEFVELSQLFSKVSDFKEQGYRMGQICGVVLDDDTYQLIYSFDKDHQLYNLRLNIKIGRRGWRILYTGHSFTKMKIADLFDIKFNHSTLDYNGTFFKVIEEAPWKPEEIGKEGNENG